MPHLRIAPFLSNRRAGSDPFVNGRKQQIGFLRRPTTPEMLAYDVGDSHSIRLACRRRTGFRSSEPCIERRAVGDQRLAIASHASFINFFHDNDLGIEPVLEIVSISISPFLP